MIKPFMHSPCKDVEFAFVNFVNFLTAYMTLGRVLFQNAVFTFGSCSGYYFDHKLHRSISPIFCIDWCEHLSKSQEFSYIYSHCECSSDCWSLTSGGQSYQMSRKWTTHLVYKLAIDKPSVFFHIDCTSYLPYAMDCTYNHSTQKDWMARVCKNCCSIC